MINVFVKSEACFLWFSFLENNTMCWGLGTSDVNSKKEKWRNKGFIEDLNTFSADPLGYHFMDPQLQWFSGSHYH